MKKNTQIILGVLGLLVFLAVLANKGKREGKRNMKGRGSGCQYGTASTYVNALDDALLHHGSEHSSLRRRGMCGNMVELEHGDSPARQIEARLQANDNAVAYTRTVLNDGAMCRARANRARMAGNALRAAAAVGAKAQKAKDIYNMGRFDGAMGR